jgi:hypothetical protein
MGIDFVHGNFHLRIDFGTIQTKRIEGKSSRMRRRIEKGWFPNLLSNSTRTSLFAVALVAGTLVLVPEKQRP